MTEYFRKLPTVFYNGTPARNILARSDLSKASRRNNLIFYPYTMEEGERVDVVSHNYYEDPDYSWLIYLTNGVIDPFYDVSIDDESFQAMIVSKYGSLADAAQGIKFYRNNWPSHTDENISIGAYESLAANVKKYWDPIVDANYRIRAYRRKRADWIVNTNKVIQITTEETETPFTFVDTIYKTTGLVQDASGLVVYSNSTSLTVQHIVGEFPDSSYQITSRFSNSTANVVSVSTIQENLDAEEAVYYSPVSYLDWEEEQNMAKKEIRLVDNRLAGQAAADLKKSMAENG